MAHLGTQDEAPLDDVSGMNTHPRTAARQLALLHHTRETLLQVPLKGTRSGCIDDVYRTSLDRFVQFDGNRDCWVCLYDGTPVEAPLSGKGRPRALRL